MKLPDAGKEHELEAHMTEFGCLAVCCIIGFGILIIGFAICWFGLFDGSFHSPDFKGYN